MDAANEEQAVNRIQVVVRVRPILTHELSEPIAVTCSADGTQVQVALPEKETSKPALAASTRPDAKAYGFDACLTGSTTQAQLFDICGIDELVEAAVDGYNITIFAFGQTGSGKTYSIIGPSIAGFQEAAWSAAEDGRLPPGPVTPTTAVDIGLAEDQAIGGLQAGVVSDQQQADQQLRHDGSNNSNDNPNAVPAVEQEDGLLSRCVMQLYSCIEACRQQVTCKVIVSCCEIYNEAVTDLLAKNKNQQLQVRQDTNEGFYVDGLTLKDTQTPNRALRLVSDALMHRHTRAHRLNTHSSRSHCLITFTISSQELSSSTGAQGGVRRVGKLVLVDLAGSERLKDTGNSAKEAVRETGSINKSLFTLGQVLAALSIRSGCGITGHVPYRDSRLTQLLWDGLKGGGRALMLACLSPLKAHAEETLNTLHFASMALRIKSQPIIMMDPQACYDGQLKSSGVVDILQDQMVLEMRDTIKGLQEDCRSLAAAITQMTTGADMSSVLQGLPPTLVQDALRYGSSSAPASQMTPGQSPTRRGGSLRTSGGGVRASSKSALGALRKPSTADPTTRHSLPSLYSSSSSANKQAGASSSKKQKLRQPAQAWDNSTFLSNGNGVFYGSPASALGQTLGAAYSSSSSNRSSWPAFATPPRTGSPLRNSLGPGSPLVPRSAAGPDVRGTVYTTGSPGGAGWTGVAQHQGSALLPGPNSPNSAAYTAALTSHMAGTQASGSATAGRGVGDFPELAALEQQFQQQFILDEHQQQYPALAEAHQGVAGLIAQPGDPVREFAAIGTNGVLVDSGLPASIQAPPTLIPVRLGVADTETVGTSPDASPVVVAIAAAERRMRPIAVSLPPGVTNPCSTSTSGACEGHNSSGNAAVQDQEATAVSADIQPPPVPEPKALGWAERNIWFGADTEMTQLAYQVHDSLVAQGVDPASDTYYPAIEAQVAGQLPDKWAQWQATMAAAAGSTALGRSKPQQQQSSPVAYTSYRIPLKSPVPKLSGTVAAAPQQRSSSVKEPGSLRQQQPPQPLWVPSGVSAAHQLQMAAASGASAHSQGHKQQSEQQVHAAPTLSLLLQAPRVSGTGPFNPAPQQQTAGSNLPGKAFAEQMLQLYQQHGSSKMVNQASRQQVTQHHELQVAMEHHAGMQQQQELAPPSPAGSLPELRKTASPVPPPAAVSGTAGLAGLGHSAVPGQLLYNATVAGNQCAMQSTTQLQCTNRLGGVTAAASQVLAANRPSYYNGAGPLTAGSKQNWTMCKSARNVQAGRDLVQVLRSGVNPGNKSLADLQADYRAARALVLDQLRRQKEETEQQKKRILLQIGRAINSNRWQT